MTDYNKLVEQARKGADKYERAAWFEVSDLLTKLADAVEQLQANAVNLRRAWREDSDGQHETNRLLAAERDDARARVATLEAGCRQSLKMIAGFNIGRAGDALEDQLLSLLDEDGGEFRCSCGRTFETLRGLHVHQAHRQHGALLDGRVPSTGQETT